MRVFNLAEELEKERKKNKELESKLKATNKILNDMDNIAGEYEDRIDKAIKYIEKTDTFQIVHSTDELAERLREKTIKDLLDILNGDNNG